MKIAEEPYDLIGSVPSRLKAGLVSAVKSVSPKCFFDEDGSALKREIRELDDAIASNLEAQGYAVQTNFCPFLDNRFNVDLAIPEQKLLIEIEKGKQPRLELDILKIASACSQFLDRWRYGALVVPASYIELPLAGRQSPYAYLKRLGPLLQPLFTGIEGLPIIGYDDPRR